jgi:RNA 2',3'-cyclic 3'-phosphodiesterase
VRHDLIRTFIAVDIREDVRRRLAEGVSRLRRHLESPQDADAVDCDGSTGSKSNGRRDPRFRWARPEGWHVTLKFLGEIPTSDVAVVCDTARVVSERTPAFEVGLRGWGFFPSERRPRILWAGIQTGCEELVRLAADLDQSLGYAGFERDNKPYRPHVTIARTSKSVTGSGSAMQAVTLDCGSFVADGIVIIQSTLQRGGSVYEPPEVCRFNTNAEIQ